MLCGNTISAIVVATNAVLRELECVLRHFLYSIAVGLFMFSRTKRDNIEVYLAFGATRLEACRPIAIEALRIALLPTVNSMSVIGLISIPGDRSNSSAPFFVVRFLVGLRANLSIIRRGPLGMV